MVLLHIFRQLVSGRLFIPAIAALVDISKVELEFWKNTPCLRPTLQEMSRQQSFAEQVIGPICLIRF